MGGVSTNNHHLGKVLDEKVKTDIRSVLEASKLVGLDFKVPWWIFELRIPCF